MRASDPPRGPRSTGWFVAAVPLLVLVWSALGSADTSTTLTALLPVLIAVAVTSVGVALFGLLIAAPAPVRIRQPRSHDVRAYRLDHRIPANPARPRAPGRHCS